MVILNTPVEPPEHRVGVSVGVFWLQTESQRLVQDKEELLAQVVSLQRQWEAAQAHTSKLVGKVEDLEKLCVQRDTELREVSEELKSTKVSLSTREGLASHSTTKCTCVCACVMECVCVCVCSGAASSERSDTSEFL